MVTDIISLWIINRYPIHILTIMLYTYIRCPILSVAGIMFLQIKE